MATKALRKFVPPLLFFLCLASLWAQESPRFTQRLAWNKDASALRYEVIVERQTTGGYRRLQREFTADNFIRFSLSPGNYRCRVTPYNYLNRPGEASEWMIFEVRAALNPEVDNFTPALLNPNKDTTLSLFGRNLSSGAEIFLQSLDKSTLTITPAEIQILYNGREARLVFNKRNLTAGNYEIYVRNPGGLETSKKGLTISYSEPPVKVASPEPKPEVKPEPKPEKPEPEKAAPKPAERPPRPPKTAKPKEPLDIGPLIMSLNAAWMPLIPSDGAIKEVNDDVFGGKPQLAGAALRFDLLFTKPEIIYPGLELAASGYFLTNPKSPYSSDVKALSIDLNLLLQKRFFDERFAATLRAGVGFSFQNGGLSYNGHKVFELDGDGEGKAPYMNLGVSLLWAATEHICVETGINYVSALTEDKPSKYFRPWIGVGWQF